MSQADQDYRKYLTPRVLSAVKGLELRARLIVEGFLGGMHHSPHHGLSIEFADHRVYTQGDDIRHVDWKLYGKTDKYYIKEYEQETNLSVLIVVDGSESMAFKGGDAYLSKHEYATSIAAALSYLALSQHDSVGLVTFDNKVTGYIKPSNHTGHWRTLVRELAQSSCVATTSVSTVLEQLTERLSRRSLIVLISDLFDQHEAIRRGLQRLRFRHHDVIVLNVWDGDELALPLHGPVMFEGMEALGTLQAEPDTLRQGYIEQVQAFQSTMGRECGRLHIDYEVLNTSKPLDTALTAYLATRSGRLRQRSARVMGSG
ncbi:MAG: DUF58 domain-containing protein [Planctomycetota bacterium]|jgi:uncharacterized protein (DUF58 family)